MIQDPGFTAALVFAFSSGVAAFFAPCAAPLLPGYVGYYVSLTDDEVRLSGALARGLATGAGTLVVFGGMALVAFAAGQSAFDDVGLLEPAVGVALALLGVVTLAGRGPTWSVALPKRRSTVFGFGIFGGMYALAATGCVAPMFLAVAGLALTFPVTAAFAVFGAYAAGLALLMTSATVAIAVGYDVGASRLAGYTGSMTRIAGVVMLVSGVLEVANWAVTAGWL